MSFGEKILKLRKKHGLSQEELGEKIKVTRQTISNWELGETSPNPEQLKLLSKELQISIDELLDNDLQNVLVKKVSTTEYITNKSFILLKVLSILIAFIIVILFLLFILKIIIKNSKDEGQQIEKTIHCKLYGEEHSLKIGYYELSGKSKFLGDDLYFVDILGLEKYSDINQILNIINDYVKKNNGTCEIIENHDLNDVVNMYVKENSLTKTSATIIVEELIDYNISYGEPFWIEKMNYQTNKWEKLENKCSNCAFNLPAYRVTPDKPLVLKHDWQSFYGELSKGDYRLVKEAFFESDIPIDEDDIYYIWTEFYID